MNCPSRQSLYNKIKERKNECSPNEFQSNIYKIMNNCNLMYHNFYNLSF